MNSRTLLYPVTLVLLLLPRIAFGCAIGPKPTVLEAYKNADVVVIARAISIEKVSDQSPTPLNASRVLSTTMEVQKVFKGNLNIGDKVTFSQGNGIRCTWVFYEDVIGKEYLFYLETPPNGEALWYEFGYSRSDLISRTADDLLYLNNLQAVHGRTRISGTLRAGEDEYLVGRKVWLLGKNKVYESTTDKNGVYEFYELPPGKYVLEPELPQGLKIDRETRGTTTISDKNQISTRQIRFTLKPRQHAAIDLEFVIGNVVSGSVVDSEGKPLPQVQVSLKPTVEGDSFDFDYTDEQGRFTIESIDPGNYILVINEDGKKTIKEPFTTLYYPNVFEKAKARVFQIGAGDNLKGLKVVVPNPDDIVTIKGMVRYADGTPPAEATVRFTPSKETGVDGSAMADTNAKGEFSFKIFKGVAGELHADFFAYGVSTASLQHKYNYRKCPQVERIVRESGNEMVKTPPLKIDPQQDLLNLVLTFPFRRCR